MKMNHAKTLKILKHVQIRSTVFVHLSCVSSIHLKTKGEKPQMSTFAEAEEIINFVFGDF